MDIEPVTGDYPVDPTKVNIVIPILPRTPLYFPLLYGDCIDSEAFDIVKTDWLAQLTTKQIECVRTLIRYDFHLGTVHFISTFGTIKEVSCHDADSIHFETRNLKGVHPKPPHIWPALLRDLNDWRVNQNGILYYMWTVENIDWKKRISYIKCPHKNPNCEKASKNIEGKNKT